MSRQKNQPLRTALIAAGTIVLTCRIAGPTLAEVTDGDEIDSRWLDRLDGVDRACLDQLLGYAPPAFTNDLRWSDDKPLRWKDLRGKVVVIQTWTSKTPAGRNWAMRAQHIIDEPNREQVIIIALHTPQGADTVDTFLERRPLEVPTAIDSNGRFCDSLGAYQRPVNVVVDRNGTVRYVGLNQHGLRLAVARLFAEPFDESTEPIPMPAHEPANVAEFPPFTIPVTNARDIRGQRAPTMYVMQWLNGAVITRGKVVVIEFWATSCEPCIDSIPHTNDLAERFGDEVVIVGITNESTKRFQEGLTRLGPSDGITLDTFRYYLASDPTASMGTIVQLTGIPHTIVMSSDWIVRWQGYSTSLTAADLSRIVAADKAMTGGVGAAPSCNRWAAERSR